MKLLYNIKEKGRLVVLLIIFLIIEILSNHSQTDNVSKLDTAINEIYSDRLMAQDYIYKISENIHSQKVFLLNRNPSNVLNKLLNRNFNEIKSHIINYEKTSLTNPEKILFDKFKSQITGLYGFLGDKSQQILLNDNTRNIYITQLDSLSDKLKGLSEIQISRSAIIKNDSIKIVSFSSIINQLSSVLLIITTLYIIAIVFTSKSVSSKFHQQEHLN